MKEFLFTILLVGFFGACSSTDKVMDTPTTSSEVSDSTDLVEEPQDTIPRQKITRTSTHFSVSKPAANPKAKKENM